MNFNSNPRIGLVSTFPPTVCGIASYSRSLVGALAGRDGRAGSLPGVVRLTDGPTRRSTGLPVVFNQRRGDRVSLRAAAAMLNTYDTVSIQHEYGIYGGRDGADVLDLMSRLTVPTAVTLHTVLNEPTPHQREVMDGVCSLAERIVVMSETASSRLADRYGVDPMRVNVIPHGADPEFAGPSLAEGGRPLVLTWGLIGPGKGLEWAIEAFADLVDMDPLPRYRIVGATHPHVRRESGERYREQLMELTARMGLGEVVEFDDRYLSRGGLARLVRRADVVVLPYESAEQVTSGVLVEAIAASKPVVATAFPHAVELLSSGAGALVPFGDPHRLSKELRRILSDAATWMSMAQQARQLAADWYWPAIAARFSAVMTDITAAARSVSPSTRDRQLATG